MSRIGYSEDEDFPGQFELWQANCRRSLEGKKGQAALRELEAALLALPEKRLIAGRLRDDEGQVCSLGALAQHKSHAIPPASVTDEFGEYETDYDMEDFGVEIGLPRLVAWKIVEVNDIQINGHYVEVSGPLRPEERYRPQRLVPPTPEERYAQMLAWVRSNINRAV